MWLTDGFLLTLFRKWRGQCAHMLISVWLLYTVINVCGGGGLRISENLESSENFKFL